MVKEMTDANHTTEIAQNPGYVLIDFWAEWCGPCKNMKPIFDQIADEFKDRVKSYKVDVDKNPEVSTKYMIRALPSFVVLKDGEMQEMEVGMLSYEKFKQWLETVLTQK